MRSILVASLKLLLLHGCMVQGSFEWSWDRLPVFTYGTNTSCCPYNGSNYHCCSGVDSSAELDFKTKFDVVLIDNELSSPGCINMTTGKVNLTACNDFRAARAADVKVDANHFLSVFWTRS